jgi:tRNA(Ile)-lysidine synthase
VDILERIERHVRSNELIVPGGEVTCLVSGGADSTCLFHSLRELGYRVSAFHVNYGLRGEESDADAQLCAEQLGAEVVRWRPLRGTEAELREIRYSLSAGGLRATGHTATDQVETILYRLVSSGTTKGIKACREDGVVRPLLTLWREETEAYCRERGLAFRVDASNPSTVRGLIRGQVLPLLELIHPAARENVLRSLEERRTLPPALAELLDAPVGSKRVDLGGGLQAVREHDRVWLEHGPVDLRGEVRWGPWLIRSALPGLKVRGWRPGDRLAGRSRKIQDVFVDAKIPRSEREAWPLVVRGGEVVAVPGLIDAPGVTAVRE